jgi:hypothetical protein
VIVNVPVEDAGPLTVTETPVALGQPSSVLQRGHRASGRNHHIWGTRHAMSPGLRTVARRASQRPAG